MAPGKRAASSSPLQGSRHHITDAFLASLSLSSQAFLSQKHRGVCPGTPKEEREKDSGPARGRESEGGVLRRLTVVL